MSDYEFTISLRIRHPTMDPDRITQMLGIDPRHTWMAGEPRRGETDELLHGTYRQSYWTAGLMDKPESASSEVKIESVLLQKLAKLRLASDFLRELRQDGGGAELHVSILVRNNFRLELLAEVQALLGRLGLDFSLDVQTVRETPQAEQT